MDRHRIWFIILSICIPQRYLLHVTISNFLASARLQEESTLYTSILFSARLFDVHIHTDTPHQKSDSSARFCTALTNCTLAYFVEIYLFLIPLLL